MSDTNSLLLRLAFLMQVIKKEAAHLKLTDARLFAEAFTAERVTKLASDVEFAERVDAFVARFGRLQDTLGDKLLPCLLAFLGERTGAVIDNLDKAERLGLITSADDWLSMRQLRNQMIHDYIQDPTILVSALNAGHSFVHELLLTAESMTAEFSNRSSNSRLPD